MKRINGWTPDVPDYRDHSFRVTHLAPAPPRVDLRPMCPGVFDQGDLGSCTANAIANAYRFDLMKQGTAKQRADYLTFVPSRLFIYYNERAMERTIHSDAGAQIRDGIKSIAQRGVCSELEWSYSKKFDARPTAVCYHNALNHQAVEYQRVDSGIDGMRHCLAAGYPFVFGFTVYTAFESDHVARFGVLNLPQHGERTEGGHAVLCVGYDDATRRVIVMNSWGTAWGQHGYFTMPYDYISDPNLADDMWTVRAVE